VFVRPSVRPFVTLLCYVANRRPKHIIIIVVVVTTTTIIIVIIFAPRINIIQASETILCRNFGDMTAGGV